MSRWRREPLALGLDAGLLALAGAPLASAAATGWHEPQLRLALAAAGAGRARLLLCPDLCRHFVQPVPAGLRTLAELQRLAAARAAQLFGGSGADWAAVADWDLARPFVVAACPAPLLQALRGAAVQAKVALVVESAALAALERLAAMAPRVAGGAFVGWASPGHVMLAHVTDGRADALRCLRRPVALGGEALAAFVAREAAQEALRTPGAGAAVLLAQSGDGAGVRGFDSGSTLPPPADEPEACWSSRLAALIGR